MQKDTKDNAVGQVTAEPLAKPGTLTPLNGGFSMMPAAPGTCPECATTHEPTWPHNRDSLPYQMLFHNRHNRWPTWADAMAHCDKAMRGFWTEELTKRGVDINGANKKAKKKGEA